MADFFFYGTLRHAPLLAVVLGRAPDTEPAVLEGHAVRWAEGQVFTTLIPAAGARAEGCLLRGVIDAAAARLDFYQGGFGYEIRDVSVTTARGPATARVCFPDAGLRTPGAPFDLADWVGQWGKVVTAAAAEMMAGLGQHAPATLRARYPQILIRAAARLRAARAAPVTLRHAAAPGDVATDARRQPYARFFAVEEEDLRFRRFDGTMSERVTRAAFVSGDAATVLPFDPGRDRVMLIEQFRMGPHGRGDPQPWSLEAIAGRVDAGETPEDCARREAVEEAGLTLRDLLPVAGFYPSPGAKTEYVWSYIGLADLPDSAAGLGGVADETEDIRAHVIGFDRLMRLIETGEAENGPLLVSAFWLACNRDRLRAGG